MAFTSTETAAKNRLGGYSNADFANDGHRTNFTPALNDTAIVAAAMAREAGAVAGAAAVIQALDADTDGAIAQYVQADISLRFAAGGIQKHLTTVIIDDIGQELPNHSGDSDAVWVDPSGVEHTGTYTTTQIGAHHHWVPVTSLGAGGDVRALIGGNVVKMLFPANVPLVVVVCANNPRLKSFEVPSPRTLKALSCYGNSLNDGLDLSAHSALTSATLTSNGFTQPGIDLVLSSLVAAGGYGGVLKLTGSNAPPSATGLADVQTLENRNWVVTH